MVSPSTFLHRNVKVNNAIMRDYTAFCCIDEWLTNKLIKTKRGTYIETFLTRLMFSGLGPIVPMVVSK